MATVKLVAIKDIKKASWNPRSRTEGKDAIKTLGASIQEVGLLYPVLVDKNNNLIDGHRRLAAYERLGLVEIPALIVDGDKAVMFAHVSTHFKKLSGNQQMQVFLKNPDACAGNTRAWLTQAEEALGRQLLERMAKEGLSLHTFRLARRLARESDIEDPGQLKAIVKWMLHYRNMGMVQRALENGTPVGKIMAAVNRNKAIRVTYDAA